MSTVRPENEADRLKALDELQIVGTDRSPEFDAVVDTLAAIFECPIALISLVAESDQWFKARCGLAAEGTSRDVSFCQHAILSDDLLVVPDALEDPRFSDNPLVKEDPHIRFYAGCPVSIDGMNRLGTLCVIDRVPRSPTQAQLEQLRRLGRVVEGLITAHQLRREKDAALAVAAREHELAVNESDLLEEITSVSGVGGWELSVKTDTLTWTAKTKEIHEVPSDFKPTVDLALFFYPPDSRGVVSKAVENAIEHGTGWDLELPFVTAKGRNIWVRAAGRPILENGEVVRLIGAFQDITERKKSEQSVRYSDALQRATLQTLSEGVVLLSRSGRIQSINAAGAVLLGYVEDDIVGSRVQDLDVVFYTDGEAEGTPVDLFRQAGTHPDQLNDKVVHVTRPGETAGVWLKVSAAPIDATSEFGLDGVVMSLTDITETKRQGDTLQAIFDNFPGGMVYHDEAMRLANCNDAFRKMFKLPDELIELRPHRRDMLHYIAKRGDFGPGEPEEIVQERYAKFDSKEQVQHEQVFDDGTVLDTRSTPLPNGGVVFSYFDITGLKRTEQTIRHAEAVQRTTLDALSEGILLLSPDGLIESANPAAETLLGLEDESPVGRDISDLDLDIRCAEADARNCSNPFELAVRDPDSVMDFVASLRIPSKSYTTWIRINARPIDPFGENGLDGIVVSLADITETKEQADTLQAIFDNFPGGFAYYDQNFQLASANNEFIRLLDYPQEFVDQKLHLLDYLKYNAERGDYGPGEAEQLALDKFHSYDRSKPHSYVRSTAAGNYLEIRGTPLPSGGAIYNFFDVTDRKRMEEQLAENERGARLRSEELEAILANMRQGVSVFDAKGRLTLWNQQYVDIFGKPEEDVRAGATLMELIEAEKARGEFEGDVQEHVMDLLIRLSAGEVVQSKFKHPNGTIISTVHAPLPGGGWIGTHEDVTQRELAVQKIEYAAHHDTLTGLANRSLFNSRLEMAVKNADEDAQSVLMLLDLDKFKPVNDTYGHDVGDELLRQVGQRLKACVRSSDLVARLGGDEFGIILDRATRTVAEVIASRIVRKLQSTFDVEDLSIHIGTSVGISPISGDVSETNTIIKNADIALYDVKKNGRNGFKFQELPEAPRALEA